MKKKKDRTIEMKVVPKCKTFCFLRVCKSTSFLQKIKYKNTILCTNT